MGSPSRAVLHALLAARRAAATFDLGFHVSAVHARHFFCLFPQSPSRFFFGASRSQRCFSYRCSWRLGRDSRRYVAVVAPPKLVAAAVLVMSLIVSKRLFRFRNLGGCVVSFVAVEGPSSPHTSWALKPWSRFPALPEKSFLLFLFLSSL